MPGPSLRASTVPPCISDQTPDERKPMPSRHARTRAPRALNEEIERRGSRIVDVSPAPLSLTDRTADRANDERAQPDATAHVGVLSRRC
jgi:hypothetical protein